MTYRVRSAYEKLAMKMLAAGKVRYKDIGKLFGISVQGVWLHIHPEAKKAMTKVTNDREREKIAHGELYVILRARHRTPYVYKITRNRTKPPLDTTLKLYKAKLWREGYRGDVKKAVADYRETLEK